MHADLELLTGPAAQDLLAAVVAPAGESLVHWRVRQVDHRPGSGTTAAYDVRVRDRDGERCRVLGAATGPAAAAPGAGGVRCSAGDREVVAWRFPLDPALPALVGATDETAVRRLLDDCDVEPGPVDLRLRGYRPGRRAVVEVRTPARTLFLKVLRPQDAPAVHARHLLLREAGLPVPVAHGRREDGLLVLDAVPGTSLRARLRTGGAADLDAELLLQLLDRLPVQLCALPRRRSPTDAVVHYAAVTAAALPEQAERCRQLAERVRTATAEAAGDEPVHGDLYETQLLLDGARVSGLLDVDTAGPGRRSDDLACLLAHLHVLAQAEPAHRGPTLALARAWQAAFERRVDPADLRARVAGVVVSLATGPHRVQQPGWQEATCARLALAERWLDSADRRGSGLHGRR